MKKLLLFSILFSSLTFNLLAQDFDLQWTDKKVYRNNTTGYFNGFAGSNKKYVYSFYNNLAVRSKKKFDRLDLVAHDRNSMAELHTVNLRGEKDDKARQQLLKGKEYFRIITLEDVIYIFWKDEKDNNVSIYVEAYSIDLNLTSSMKKVFSVDYPDIKKKKYSKPPIVILNGKNWGNDVLVGTEIHSGEGETIQFEYIVMDSELNIKFENDVDLPIAQLEKKSSGLSSGYEYGDDGKLYINSRVISEYSEQGTRGSVGYTFSKLTIIDLPTGEINSIDLKLDQKHIQNYRIVTTAKGTKIFGFYSDKTIDEEASGTSGIFSVTLDPEFNEVSDLVFSQFDEELLNELFKDDEEDKKKTVGRKKKRKANEELDKVSLDRDFKIESIRILENGKAILFTSKMRNYSVTTCTTSSSGGTTCTTSYYCEKSNVTVFAMDEDSQLEWTSNLDREYTYGGWNVYDLRIIERNKKAYVFYGNRYTEEVDKKNRKSSKDKEDLRDKLEYAVFDLENGEYQKNELVINTPTTEKKDRKSVSALSIVILDDEFYVSSKKVRYRPGLTTAGCIASLACFPVIYTLAFSPVYREGIGYIGKIDVIE